MRELKRAFQTYTQRYQLWRIREAVRRPVFLGMQRMAAATRRREGWVRAGVMIHTGPGALRRRLVYDAFPMRVLCSSVPVTSEQLFATCYSRNGTARREA